MKSRTPHHYTQCGLGNVFLLAQLAELDDTDHLGDVQFEDTDQGWAKAA